jgi:hypothetical protein
MKSTFDRSPALGLALVACADLRHPHYVPLAGAPADLRDIDPACLRQLHIVANGVVAGLVAQQRGRLMPEQWERLQRKR